jgi:hypothetical protein
MFSGTPLWESYKESSSAIFKLRDQKELAKLSNDIPQIIQILNNLSPIGRVERSKELAKLSTDIPQIIQILKIMRSAQIILILNNLFSRGLPINKIAKKRYQRGCIERPSRARDGSNKQETLVGMSGS